MQFKGGKYLKIYKYFHFRNVLNASLEGKVVLVGVKSKLSQ